MAINLTRVRIYNLLRRVLEYDDLSAYFICDVFDDVHNPETIRIEYQQPGKFVLIVLSDRVDGYYAKEVILESKKVFELLFFFTNQMNCKIESFETIFNSFGVYIKER